MPDLGTIQLASKFYTLTLCLPRGMEISPLSQNAASLYAFPPILPRLLATLWGWFLSTGVQWLSLNNEQSNEKSKILQNSTFV